MSACESTYATEKDIEGEAVRRRDSQVKTMMMIYHECAYSRAFNSAVSVALPLPVLTSPAPVVPGCPVTSVPPGVSKILVFVGETAIWLFR